jgi:hypothetical protein
LPGADQIRGPFSQPFLRSRRVWKHRDDIDADIGDIDADIGDPDADIGDIDVDIGDMDADIDDAS